MTPTPQTHLAAVLYGPHDLRLERRPTWPPGPGQCQVEIKATGLCGSDLHYYHAFRNGPFAVRSPLVLGHESSGTITALGPGVAAQYPGLYVGRNVVVECGVPCRGPSCRFCSSGRYNLCPRLAFCSSAKTFPHRDGMLQQKINHEAWCLIPLPSDLPLSLASLVEPLSVLIHASRRAGLMSPHSGPSLGQLPSTFNGNSTAKGMYPSKAGLGGTVPTYPRAHAYNGTTTSSQWTNGTILSQSGPRILVLGAGTIGLLACALAKEQFQAARVCIVDIDRKRLELAEKKEFVFGTPFGEADTEGGQEARSKKWPNAYCLPGKPKDNVKNEHEDPLKRARANAALVLGVFGETEGFDFVFECTGVEACVTLGVYCTLPGSTLLLIGMGAPVISSFPLAHAALREVDIIGSFRYADACGEGVRLMMGRGDGKKVSDTSSEHSNLAANGVSSVLQEVGTLLPSLSFIEKLSSLITHRFPLSEAGRAFELLSKGRDENGEGVLKVLVEN